MTTEQPTIRRAVPGDLDGLLALAEAYCAADHHDFAADRVRAAMAPLLEDDRHGIILVLDGLRGPSGYAVVTWGYSIESGGIECLLDEIYIADRGRGLGRRLLDACLARAREHGCRTMFLETEAHNDGARRFYARAGFTAETSVWMGRPLI